MSHQLLKDELPLFTKYLLVAKQYGAARNIPFSLRMGLRRHAKSAQEIPPLCVCGCGELVNGPFRKTWPWYLPTHQPKPGASREAYKRLSARMKSANPMRIPEVAMGVGLSRRGKPINRSPEGLLRISVAARKRMLSDNPMRKKESFQRANANRITPMESVLCQWFQGMPIQFAGDGSGFIDQLVMCPDFVVTTQNCKRVIEVSTAKSRGSRYAKQRIRKYASADWECLVILSDQIFKYKNEILELVNCFVKGGGSGAWKSGLWIGYNALIDQFTYSTFHAVPRRHT